MEKRSFQLRIFISKFQLWICQCFNKEYRFYNVSIFLLQVVKYLTEHIQNLFKEYEIEYEHKIYLM